MFRKKSIVNEVMSSNEQCYSSSSSQTRAISSMVECAGRRMVLVIHDMKEAADPNTDVKDCDRGRKYLEDQIDRVTRATKKPKTA